MNVGLRSKQAFEHLLRRMGSTVQIHKHWGTPNQQTVEAPALKNGDDKLPNKVMFQFSQHMNIEIGDVLQQMGSYDSWRVIETEDQIVGGVYVCFEVSVEKPSNQAAGAIYGRSQVIVQGSVFGGIQIDSPHATQSVSAQVLQVDENLCRLRELLQRAPISGLEKEDASQALDRISQLMRKQRNPEVIAKIKEKLELVKITFDLAKDIAGTAAPYLTAIGESIAR